MSGPIPLSIASETLLRAMRAANVRGPLVHAFKMTGLLVTNYGWVPGHVLYAAPVRLSHYPQVWEELMATPQEELRAPARPAVPSSVPARLEIPKELVTELQTMWNLPVAVSPEQTLTVIKASCFKGDASKASNEELLVFLTICKRYQLNPLIREVHAFVRDGAVYPIVGVDGWHSLVVRNPRYNGHQYIEVEGPDKKVTAVTCRIYVRGFDHPVEVTEYMAECFRATAPWQRWPRRMLRHKAFIQCAREAFGYGDIYDPDEAERIREAVDVTHTSAPRVEIRMPQSLGETSAGPGPEPPTETLP